ncbi:hypothetical protein [Streptomyces sp. NPDC017260]|uniref:hypothetical protein n=1 Tax=unclassified Streptomyces TaxID=2593676 RepID=UPI003789D4E5
MPPLGEVHPAARCTVRQADTCERGLFHPVDELDVTFMPRLADLTVTAMRRNATGHPAMA